jgi:hypothetical protein
MSGISRVRVANGRVVEEAELCKGLMRPSTEIPGSRILDLGCARLEVEHLSVL